MKAGLSKQFQQFLKTVVKQRQYALRAGVSRKSQTRMRMLTDKFQRYIGYKFTDAGAAGFIIRNQFEIRELIIEKNTNQITRFDNLLISAKMFNQKQLAL